MSLVVLTFLVGLVNLGLGYVLAVRLGFGPPGLWDAWEALAANRPTQAAGLREPVARVRSTEAAAQQPGGPSLEELLDEPYEDPNDESYDDHDENPAWGERFEEPELDGPEDWDLDERFVEVSVLKLNIAMLRSGTRTTDIEARLRAVAGRSDAKTIGKCHQDLLEDCDAFLADHGQAAERFRQRMEELGELKSLGEEIETANLEQAAQVQSTVSNLRHVDFESDLEAANRRLLEELKNLRVARHRLRDDQERAFVAIARCENRLGTIEKRLFHDPLTKTLNRIGIEATLYEWWEEGRQRSRQLSAALFDLDRFGEFNERHGARTADKILHRLAQFIQSKLAVADLVGRFGGQRFFMLLVDVGPQKATRNVELLRQSIERITFLEGNEEIRVTAGGGITEIKPGDTPESFVERLEHAVEQAKEAGPNRSFYHDGKQAEVVESPSLGAEYVEIPV
jgi:diguanylate cyclase (GGDEF)-like protein